MAKAPPRCWNTRTAKGGESVKYHSSMWQFQVRKYATLHDALLSVWP